MRTLKVSYKHIIHSYKRICIHTLIDFEVVWCASAHKPKSINIHDQHMSFLSKWGDTFDTLYFGDSHISRMSELSVYACNFSKLKDTRPFFCGIGGDGFQHMRYRVPHIISLMPNLKRVVLMGGFNNNKSNMYSIIYACGKLLRLIQSLVKQKVHVLVLGMFGFVNDNDNFSHEYNRLLCFLVLNLQVTNCVRTHLHTCTLAQVVFLLRYPQ